MSRAVWSRFPSEGWRSEREGSRFSFQLSSRRRAFMKPEFNESFLGVESARLQPISRRSLLNVSSMRSGVLRGAGSGCEWGFRETIIISGWEPRSLGVYISNRVGHLCAGG